MVKKTLLTVVAALGLSVAAVPAFADSLFIGFGVGDHGGHHEERHEEHHEGWHGYDHHDFFEHEEEEHEHFHYWGAPVFYEPRPVVYYQEPQVIERRVIFDETQVLQATPGRIVSNNPYCREYQRSITVGNHMEQSYGTACRQPDGAWKIVNEAN